MISIWLFPYIGVHFVCVLITRAQLFEGPQSGPLMFGNSHIGRNIKNL